MVDMKSMTWVSHILVLLFCLLISYAYASGTLCNLSGGYLPVEIYHDPSVSLAARVLSMTQMTTLFHEVKNDLKQLYGVEPVLRFLDVPGYNCCDPFRSHPTTYDECDWYIDDKDGIVLYIHDFCQQWRELPPEVAPPNIVQSRNLDAFNLLGIIQQNYPDCEILQGQLTDEKTFHYNGIVEDGEECDTLPSFARNAGCKDGAIVPTIRPTPISACSACGTKSIRLGCDLHTDQCTDKTVPCDDDEDCEEKTITECESIYSRPLDDLYCTTAIGLPLERLNPITCEAYDRCPKDEFVWIFNNDPDTATRTVEPSHYGSCVNKHTKQQSVCADELVRYINEPQCYHLPSQKPIDNSYCLIIPDMAYSETIPCVAGDDGFTDTPCVFWACGDRDTIPTSLPMLPSDTFPSCDGDDTTTGITYQGCDVVAYHRDVTCVRYNPQTEELSILQSDTMCLGYFSKPLQDFEYPCEFQYECPMNPDDITYDTPPAQCNYCDDLSCATTCDNSLCAYTCPDNTSGNGNESGNGEDNDTSSDCNNDNACMDHVVVNPSALCIGRQSHFKFIQLYDSEDGYCGEGENIKQPSLCEECYLNEDYQHRCMMGYYCNVLDNDLQPTQFESCSSDAIRYTFLQNNVQCQLDGNNDGNTGEECGNGVFDLNRYTRGCYSAFANFDKPLPSSHCQGTPPGNIQCDVPCKADWRCAIVPTDEYTSGDGDAIADDQYRSHYCSLPLNYIRNLDGCGTNNFTIIAKCFSDEEVCASHNVEEDPVIPIGDYDPATLTSTLDAQLRASCSIACIDRQTLIPNEQENGEGGELVPPSHLPDYPLSCDSFDGYQCSNGCGNGQQVKVPVCVNPETKEILYEISPNNTPSKVFCSVPPNFFQSQQFAKPCVGQTNPFCSAEPVCRFSYTKHSTAPVDEYNMSDEFTTWSLGNCDLKIPSQDDLCGTVTREMSCRAVQFTDNEQGEIESMEQIPFGFCSDGDGNQTDNNPTGTDRGPSTTPVTMHTACTEYRCTYSLTSGSEIVEQQSHIDDGEPPMPPSPFTLQQQQGGDGEEDDDTTYTKDRCNPPTVSICGRRRYPLHSACFFKHTTGSDVSPIQSSSCSGHQQPPLSHTVESYDNCGSPQYVCKFERTQDNFSATACIADLTEAACSKYDLCGTHQLRSECRARDPDGNWVVLDYQLCSHLPRYIPPDQLGTCTNYLGCTSWQCSQYSSVPSTSYTLAELSPQNCDRHVSPNICSTKCGPGFAYRNVACISEGKDLTGTDQDSTICGKQTVKPYSAVPCDLSQTSQCNAQKYCDLGDGSYSVCPFALTHICPDVCIDSLDDGTSGGGDGGGDGGGGDDQGGAGKDLFTWDITTICLNSSGVSVNPSFCRDVDLQSFTCRARDDVCCTSPLPSPFSVFERHFFTSQIDGDDDEEDVDPECLAESKTSLTPVTMTTTTSWQVNDIIRFSWNYNGPTNAILSFYLDHPQRPSVLIHLNSVRATYFKQIPSPFSFPIDLSTVTPPIPPTEDGRSATLYVMLKGKPQFTTVIENIHISPAQCRPGPQCSASNGRCEGNVCVCNEGWTGKACNEPVSPCGDLTCLNGKCVHETEGGPLVCKCHQGFSGAYCNHHVLCTEENTTVECFNGGAPAPANFAAPTLSFTRCSACQCVGLYDPTTFCETCTLNCGAHGVAKDCERCECSEGYYGEFCNCRRVYMVVHFDNPPSFMTNDILRNPMVSSTDLSSSPSSSSSSPSYTTQRLRTLSQAPQQVDDDNGNDDNNMDGDDGQHDDEDEDGDDHQAHLAALRKELLAVWGQNIINEVSIDMVYPRKHLSIHKIGYIDGVFSAIVQVELCTSLAPQPGGDADGDGDGDADEDQAPSPSPQSEELSFRLGDVSHFYTVYQQLRYNIQHYLLNRAPRQDSYTQTQSSDLLTAPPEAPATPQCPSPLTHTFTPSAIAIPPIVRPPSDQLDTLVEQRTMYSPPALAVGQSARVTNSPLVIGEFVDVDCPNLVPPPAMCYGARTLPEVKEENEEGSDLPILAIVLGCVIPLVVILLIVCSILYCRHKHVLCFAPDAKADDSKGSHKKRSGGKRNSNNNFERKNTHRRNTIELNSSSIPNSGTGSGNSGNGNGKGHGKGRKSGGQSNMSNPNASSLLPREIEDNKLHRDWKKVVGPKGETIYFNEKTMKSSLKRPDRNGLVNDENLFE